MYTVLYEYIYDCLGHALLQLAGHMFLCTSSLVCQPFVWLVFAISVATHSLLIWATSF
jgi:hypothetical protein